MPTSRVGGGVTLIRATLAEQHWLHAWRGDIHVFKAAVVLLSGIHISVQRKLPDQS